MNNNPFTLMYGIASQSIVTREDSLNKIINSFTLQNNMYTYLITGLRGTGKTVIKYVYMLFCKVKELIILLRLSSLVTML